MKTSQWNEMRKGMTEVSAKANIINDVGLAMMTAIELSLLSEIPLAEIVESMNQFIITMHEIEQGAYLRMGSVE